MAGIFVFMTRSEGKRLLQAENPYMYGLSTRTTHIEAGNRLVPVVTFSPEKNQENYMQSTGAKLYFWDGCAMLSGYASNGSDVTDLIKKHKLLVYKTEEEVPCKSSVPKMAA